MALKVVFRRRAEQRLTELALYIASEAGAETAIGYINRIYTQCHALAELPERGRQRDDIMRGLRTVTMERRLTVVDPVLRSRIEIVTIAYAGRDFMRELRRGR